MPCKDHVALNMYSRARKAFLTFIEDHPVEVEAYQRYAIARHYMKRLVGEEKVNDFTSRLGPLLPHPMTHETDAFERAAEDRILRDTDRYADLPLNETRISSQRWRYLGRMRDLKIELEERGKKQFSILPVSMFGAKHINITSTTLHGVLKRLHKQRPQVVPDVGDQSSFIARKDERWRRYFHVPKIHKGCRSLPNPIPTQGNSHFTTHNNKSYICWLAIRRTLRFRTMRLFGDNSATTRWCKLKMAVKKSDVLYILI